MEHGSGATFKWAVPRDFLPIIGTEGFDYGVFENESFDSYLADSTCFNAGGVVSILESPYHYIYEKYNRATQEEEPDYFRIGRAIHLAVLEPDKFREQYVIQPIFTGMTKEGKESERSKEALEKKQKWLDDQAPGALILTVSEMEMLTEMIDTLLDHPQASSMFRNGKPEVTIRWTHQRTGLRCKGRPDYVTILAGGKLYFFDLKSARSVTEGLFATDAARLKYHVKMAWYYDGITQTYGRPPEACALIPVLKSIPSAAEVYWLNDDDLAKGRAQYEHAIDTLIRCMAENKWPRRLSGGRMLSLPAWTDSEPLPQFDWGSNGKQERSESGAS